MPSLTYTATRKIISGHVEDDPYTLDFDAQDVNPSDSTLKTTSISLGGLQETTLTRIEDYWQITTVPLTEYDAWQEFLYSVAAGEYFDFDPYYKSTDMEYDPVEVFLVAKSPPQRLGKTDYWIFSFSVRLVDVIT